MNLYTFDPNTQVFASHIIEIYPTTDQIARIYQFIEASNYIYDLTISWCEDQYIKYLNDETNYQLLSKFDGNKLLAEFRNTSELLKQIPLHTCRMAMYRGIEAYKRYILELVNKPKKHYPDNMTLSFDTGSDTFYIENGYAHFPGFINKSALGYKVGEIKCQDMGFSKEDKFYNISIFVDHTGKFFIYACTIQNKIILQTPKSEPIGIDLGYRLDGSNTIVCSDGARYCAPDTIHLQSRIRNFQSTLPKDIKTKSILSQKEKHNLERFWSANKKLTNVLDTFYHQSTIDIIKKNPEAIIIEDNFAADLKRKKNLIDYGVISSEKIRYMLIYKAKKYNIPVVVATSDFKSSYICSRCGRIREKDLKQSRIFKCHYCGYIIDRDLNAAINLKNLYKYSNSSLNYNQFIKEIL